MERSGSLIMAFAMLIIYVAVLIGIAIAIPYYVKWFKKIIK